MYASEQLITADNKAIVLRKLIANDLDALLHYLHHLSDETKKRFGPHAFSREAVINFYNGPGITGYVAEAVQASTIIAYTIIKTGYLPYDAGRLKSYGLSLDHSPCCTFAPSVADHWQSRGIGKALFNFILSNLKARGIRKIILWGGVQADNTKAVNFYKKEGFKTLGAFEHNGANLDMLLEINTSGYCKIDLSSSL